ncbi:MAG: hypothetical protein KF699_06000 [Phycisphaeraceae bacterium]|nr:hypothetical protein [Phycisphaeraceae bacterium]MBX3407842.1 hypothetical protein [Phycisphaeraceae bacterium]
MVPERDNTVAAGGVKVEALSEREGVRGWVFDVVIRRGADAEPSRHAVSLSWADYEYWSHGQASPSRVAEAAIAALLGARPDVALPERLDCSTCRRWTRDFDARIAAAL